MEQKSVKLEELNPELFLYELYNMNGVYGLSDALHIAVKFGYCDASRLLVRPRSGMLALMIEYEDGEKEWYHITPRMLESIRKRLARREEKHR